MAFVTDKVTLNYRGTKIHILNFHSTESSEEGSGNSVMHSHRAYEFHFATKGEYLYNIDGKSIKLSYGQMLIIPPNVQHFNVRCPDENYSFLAVCVDLSNNSSNETFYRVFKEAFDSNAYKAINVPVSLLKHCEMLKQYKLYDTVQGTCKLQAEASAFVYELMEALKAFKTVKGQTRTLDPEDLPILLGEIASKPGFTLNDIADMIGYSARHTARLLKKYGITRIR